MGSIFALKTPLLACFSAFEVKKMKKIDYRKYLCISCVLKF